MICSIQIFEKILLLIKKHRYQDIEYMDLSWKNILHVDYSKSTYVGSIHIKVSDKLKFIITILEDDIVYNISTITNNIIQSEFHGIELGFENYIDFNKIKQFTLQIKLQMNQILKNLPIFYQIIQEIEKLIGE